MKQIQQLDGRHEHKIEDALRERNRVLEGIVKDRDLLIGIISHEIRTPLTTIFGNALILLSQLESMDAETRMHALGDIREEAERLNRLVENMLLLVRASDQADIPTEPVLLRTMLCEAAAEHQMRFDRRPVTVEVKPKGLMAEGQPDYVKQVIQNLLSNAEKYSPPAAEIRVRAHRTGDEVIVSILDRGPGVAPAEAEIIFQPFYRSALTSTKVSGAGIGLTVCKLLIQAQSGRIWIKPRRGGGSIFSFSLPVTCADSYGDASPIPLWTLTRSTPESDVRYELLREA